MVSNPSTPGTPMYAIGIVVLIAVAGYVIFMAVDTVGVATEATRTTVVSTGYRAAGQTYVTQIINNRPLVTPRTVPEVFLVNVEIAGQVVSAAVERDVHDRLREGDEVNVTFRRTRLTGRTEVIAVE